MRARGARSAGTRFPAARGARGQRGGDEPRRPRLRYAAAVSSLGSIEFRMSEWRVDLAVTGSQKGLMLPAGLGIVCASPKALAAAKDAKCARAFFSFADMQRTNGEGYFPYTPNLPL